MTEKSTDSNSSDVQPFKCMECEKVVTTESGDWPKKCPHCGAHEWMTTMEALGDGDAETLEEEDVPDPDSD